MLLRRDDPLERIGDSSLARVGVVGVGTGVLTGFFGVGCGFRIVPALARTAANAAVGTSLLVIALTSAAAFVAHLASGSIDWAVALTFTAAAIAGALAGRRVGAHLQPRRLRQLFALLLIGVAAFLVAANASSAV